MPKVLIVEDDVGLAQMLAECLRPEAFDITLAHDGAAAAAMDLAPFDLILLDLMLPGRAGLDLLRDIRRTSPVPVVLLTALDTETDRVVGLELGADDYVTKPVKPRELAARMRAILRRAAPAAPAAATLRVGALVLDPGAREARCEDRALDLTSAEFALLERLMARAGAPVGREELARAALGRAGPGLDRNVDTLVSKVRRKLGGAHAIKTVRNIGYQLAVARGDA